MTSELYKCLKDNYVRRIWRFKRKKQNHTKTMFCVRCKQVSIFKKI